MKILYQQIIKDRDRLKFNKVDEFPSDYEKPSPNEYRDFKIIKESHELDELQDDD